MAVQTFNNNEVIQCKLKGSDATGRFENVIHVRWRCGDPISSVGLAEGIRNFFLNQLMSVVHASVGYDAIGMCRVSPSPKGFEDTQPIVPLIGLDNSPVLPSQIAYLIKIRTDDNARKGKGRFYLPGVNTAHWNQNGWTQLALSQFESIQNIMKNEFAIGGGTCIEWGVWSRGFHDTNWRGMRSLTWSTYPATMRSRRPEVF